MVRGIDFLKAHSGNSGQEWSAQAEFRKQNCQWLKYSLAIALKVRSRMKELSITQKDLAQKMNCTQQHISSLLTGKANLTLETIAKLEVCLNLDLIAGALTFVDGYEAKEQPSPKVAEPD